MVNCSKTASVSTLVSKTKALFRAILRTWTKVRGVTETAGCRSLKDMEERKRSMGRSQKVEIVQSIDG